MSAITPAIPQECVVDHYQDAQPAPDGHLVAHEVERPAQVEPRRLDILDIGERVSSARFRLE